ncbi:MAG TPA: hypothetical protein VGR62_10560 [Candidatus Binatia bacterium]|jgi:hypothetical protein|nr:hypothetical protein [Candidatus Binatia bacterium]
MPPPRADILLPARGRFDLRATVLSHAGWQLPPWDWTDGARPVLRRAELLGDGAVRLLTIRPAPGGVALRVTGRDAAEPEVLAPLAARVRTALQLDVDLAPFHRWCRSDVAFRPVARLGLGRLLRAPTLFEEVATTVIRVNTPPEDAARALAALLRVGARCPWPPRLRAFPTPRLIADAGVARLRRLGVGPRAAQIVQLARNVVAGRCDLAALDRHAPSRSAAVVARALDGVLGVDPEARAWLMLLLGHPDRGLVTPGSARRLAMWAPWRGLALWWALWMQCPRPEQARLRAALRPSVRRDPVRRSRRS